MKAFFKVLLVVLIVVSYTEFSSADDYSFRKTKWGMSIEQVKSSEPLEVAKEDGNFLGYKTEVIGKNMLLGYYFVDNQLVRARYILAESHTNKNDFIQDYNDFKEILTKKYGKPNEDTSLWRNSLYKDDYSGWGTAISLGHLVYYSSWETQDTEIINMLSGENYRITCTIEYISKNLKKIEQKAKEEKALDSF